MVAIVNSCPGLYNGTSTNVTNIANCFSGTLFGLDYTIFCFFALAFLALLAYKIRLPASVALAIAFTTTYMFNIAGGGSSPMLATLMALLGFGFAVTIITGLMDYVRGNS